MKTKAVEIGDFEGVFAVPPLARSRDTERSLAREENRKVIRHIESGGLTRMMYGGNAVFYHITLKEFEDCLEMLRELAGKDTWVIPSVGPSFGMAMAQAELLKEYDYPAAMFLPVSDPHDDEGVYRGISEFVECSGKPVIVYLKAENNLAVGQVKRLFNDGRAVGVKYAIVRKDPAQDAFLDALLAVVDRRRVISGIGERPAITHTMKFQLPGYTTGSGCLAPKATQRMFELLASRKPEEAERIRAQFLPLEDLRDRWNAVRVLHDAFRLSGVADTGPLPPMLSDLSEAQAAEVRPVAEKLLKFEREV